MRAGASAGARAILRALDAPGEEVAEFREMARESAREQPSGESEFVCQRCGATMGAARFRCSEEERGGRCPYERTVRSSTDATLAGIAGLALLGLANLDVLVSAWVPYLRTMDASLLGARLAHPAAATVLAGFLGAALIAYAWGRSTVIVRERPAGLGWRVDALFGVRLASRHTAEATETLRLEPAPPSLRTATLEAAMHLSEDPRLTRADTIALMALLALVGSGSVELRHHATSNWGGRDTVLSDRRGLRYRVRLAEGEAPPGAGRVGRAILRRVAALSAGPAPTQGAPLQALMRTLGLTRDGIASACREDACDWRLGAFVEQPYRGAVFEPTARGREIGQVEGAALLEAYDDLLTRFPALVPDISDAIARGLDDAMPPTIGSDA